MSPGIPFVLTETHSLNAVFLQAQFCESLLYFHWAKFYPALSLGTQTLTMTNGVIISHFRATLWVRRQINLIWLFGGERERERGGLFDNCSLKFSDSVVDLQLLLPEVPLTCCLDIGWVFLGWIQLTCHSATRPQCLVGAQFAQLESPVYCRASILHRWRAALDCRHARQMLSAESHPQHWTTFSSISPHSILEAQRARNTSEVPGYANNF